MSASAASGAARCCCAASSASPADRGFWASAAQIGPPLGTLMANGVLAILAAALTEDAFLSWGWRVAFLLSAVLVAFGLWIRTRLEETPVFRELQERGDPPAAPVTEVLRTQTRPLIAAMLARVGPDVLYAMFAVFVLTYATQTAGHEPRTGGDRGADRLRVPGRPDPARRLRVGPVGPAPGLRRRRGRRRDLERDLLRDRRSAASPPLLVGVVVGLFFHSLMYGPQAAFVSEQFHARLRYTGSSLAYTFAGIIGGAIAPLAFTYLLAKTGTGFVIAAYIVVACLVTLCGLALGRAVVDDVDEVEIDDIAHHHPSVARY